MEYAFSVIPGRQIVPSFSKLWDSNPNVFVRARGESNVAELVDETTLPRGLDRNTISLRNGGGGRGKKQRATTHFSPVLFLLLFCRSRDLHSDRPSYCGFQESP
jgi:hypothetical protein